MRGLSFGCSTDDVLLIMKMGFEFRQRRALPVISGIVIAQEHEDTLRAVRHGLSEPSQGHRAEVFDSLGRRDLGAIDLRA